jgi:hypothetical protein
VRGIIFRHGPPFIIYCFQMESNLPGVFQCALRAGLMEKSSTCVCVIEVDDHPMFRRGLI